MTFVLCATSVELPDCFFGVRYYKAYAPGVTDTRQWAYAMSILQPYL